ncbi:MAG TPA: protoporphyrinogen oxidase HemJ [Rhizomicrobium sp.]|jgi:putative membrane protein|nr:protoporphyrinogen oxidase HemJ [Rhizomicrobium sp.]
MSILHSNAFYLWVKAFHIIAVIMWMAGMLYLPRLFVYHCETQPGSAESERFKVMEKKLLRVIMNPAMIATWLFGLTLVYITRADQQHWFQAKFLLVLAMSGIHGFYAASVKRFARDANTRPQRFWRMMNEVPALLVIAVVILAVVKPF